MSTQLADRLQALLGRRPERLMALAGGCVADVVRAQFDDGGSVVVKSSPAGGLDTEAWMLGYLTERSSLPVPAVIHADDSLLVTAYIDNDGGPLTTAAQEDAARLLAELHSISAPRFGLERDTVIGGLHQPNQRTASWLEFFRDHRLLYMGGQALAQGSLTGAAHRRLELLCARLGEWLEEPASPALVHGDVWGGNVLVAGNRIAGFVDPAIYYADAEIELAFSTLFSTFGESFFDAYNDARPLAPGFFEARRDIYNVYPLLVHAVLFGAGYGASVDATLRRFVG